MHDWPIELQTKTIALLRIEYENFKEREIIEQVEDRRAQIAIQCQPIRAGPNNFDGARYRKPIPDSEGPRIDNGRPDRKGRGIERNGIACFCVGIGQIQCFSEAEVA